MMTLSRVRATTIGVSTTVLMISSSLVDAARRRFRAVPRVVNEESEDGCEGCDDADRTHDLFPQLHAPWHVRIHGQVVPLRMTVSEDRHDAGPLDAFRIVEHRFFETQVPQLRNALISELHHLLFLAELQASGRTRFDARRLEPDLDAID